MGTVHVDNNKGSIEINKVGYNTVEVVSQKPRSSITVGETKTSVVEKTSPGPAGPPNNLSIGTVALGDIAVTITGTTPNQVLNFTLPIGGAYVHTQNVSSNTWTITHNLGFYPSVNVVDSGGNTVVGDVTYVSQNVVSISFSSAFGGKAYFS